MRVEDEGHHRNRLAGEASPYLRQHASNPVDWYPWGEEAFDKARREDKPVLLSVGYATCHWCHVMERESFSDEALAAFMNEHFVSVKVDREERPDVDELYMQATIAMHGQGGWPMTVFLTPDRKPFFAGTYFPPAPRGGMPSFRQVLEHIAAGWARDRALLLEGAEQLTSVLRRGAELPLPASVGPEGIAALVAELEHAFDATHGGFGTAPKFPPHAVLRLLLRLSANGDERARRMALATLDGMARGGIRDHLAGGFSRYSTDEAWLVPHFEKMLYDNASLAALFLEAHQLTGDGRYRRVGAETLEFLLAEMRDDSGAFVSAYDADSEGEEGKYYVFTYDEILSLCGEDGPIVARAFGATPEGNFEGKNVLHRPTPLGALAEELGLDRLELLAVVERGRRALLSARSERVRPFCDDKVIASWNALAITALVRGHEVLGEPRYLTAAEEAAEALFSRLFDGKRLLRTFRGPSIVGVEGVLEDYALLGEAALDLFEATGRGVHFDRARALASRIREAFRGEEEGAYLTTSREAEALVARRTDASDGALPSAQGVAARLFLRLAHHLGDDALEDEAAAIVRAHGRPITLAPRAYATVLEVAHALLEGPVELVLAGEDTSAFDAVLRGCFVPHRVMLRVRVGDPERPLSEGRVPEEGDPPRLYLCRKRVCLAPITDPSSIPEALHAASRRGSRTRIARRSTPGAATRAGTEAALEAHGVREGAVLGGAAGAPIAPRLVPDLSRIPDVATMTAAVERAVRAGLTTLDLTRVVHRDALEAVGESIARVIARGDLTRDALVVMAGLGRLPRAELRGLEAESTPIDELEARSLHPSAIERGLLRAKEALGLEHVDVALVELPTPEVSREMLVAAFNVLEADRATGTLGRYGVSLMATGEDLEAFAERCLDAAEEVGGVEHGFSILALPVNLAQGLDVIRALDAWARRASVTLASNSPVDVRGEVPFRLVDPRGVHEPSRPTHETLAALAREEDEFERGLGATLRYPNGTPLGRFFDFARAFEAIETELDDPSAYRAVEETVVVAPLRERVRVLDRACGGALEPRWRAFKERYAKALDAHLEALRAVMDARLAARTAPYADALAPFLPLTVAGESLTRKALLFLLSHPGIDFASMPIEDAAELDAMTTLFSLPKIRDVEGAVDALLAVRASALLPRTRGDGT